MSDTLHQPRWRRLLDGGRTWGALDVSLSRYGVIRHRLVVFPPGLSPDERMLLRVWRSWPIWGTLTWLTLQTVLMNTIGPGPAFATSTGVCLGSGAVAMAMTGATRCGVRTLTVVRMVGFDDPLAIERYSELYALAEELAEADRRLAAGESTSVEHEAVVWRVYDRMATEVRP
ncbi:DUF6611 family protein [Mycobacterium sp. AZCC_0083]|uniref:DUF6611 family protein n=1 Tax=Mycobacterium sp. AZCC_0083 TaxID=2735882 RepID=UPI00161A216D|nr:DUF6611 family protein [Mycobacterium sp. AZCC_0083]MBB5162686.1 hypothetical protein [Mycobacterium sp. AZCC_0083]